MVGFTDILVTYAICTVNLVKQNDKIFDSGNPNLKRLTGILVGFTFFWLGVTIIMVRFYCT